MPTQAPQAHQAQGSKAQQAPRPYPFPVGVYEIESQDGGTMSLVQTAAPQQFPIYNVTPDGWIRGIWFDFDMVTAGNAAAVAF